MSEDPQDAFDQELAELRTLPKFQRVVLSELKRQFLSELSELAESSKDDAEKHRGVVVFISNLYESLAGEPIVGDG